jgi:hypothetical protein
MESDGGNLAVLNHAGSPAKCVIEDLKRWKFSGRIGFQGAEGAENV